ncbi:putative membrane protein [Acinetobacter phage ABPH49]|nr:putative membrane protein [Acinetobacter phage ABPH49]
MTIIFLHYGFKESLPEWYMWVYASAVAAPQLLSKLISLRWGIAPTEDKTKAQD